MLSIHGRKPAAVVIEPIARGLLKLGLSANLITVIGAIITVLITVIFIPYGWLAAAAILSGIFAASDMVDGTMARLSGGGTKFGSTLDATCDRITDGVLFATITWWLIYRYEAAIPLVIASMIVLVGSQVISYVKARGEANNLKINGGLIERPERLIIGLVGLGLQGFGIPFAIDIAIWILAAGSIFTVIQRIWIAAKDPHAQEKIAPPLGAKDLSNAIAEH
ncbi:phosphatidylinositol phosphate synthase [Corynebacterium caspium]|uniref:phosphatidylinositol phosphate synthase n=1 Tax=Corynebacterium caspium TaxID=234828 RepID=UPI000362B4C2|nr:CDP-alcohol phosphatidyltransferase family protein [Corynebacterium caspium]WKD59169.1 CDP-diacylglycerol--inositol 3-phosphatidyltransferase [Corynebacterium caspium DSM 44850]